MRYIHATDGVRLAVYEEGDPTAGQVFLLIHGFPDTHRVWDRVAETLTASGARVVRYDVRGAGRSGRPDGRDGYLLDQLADDLFTIAAEVSPDRPVHLAGHDWGSVQAWHAITDPRARDRIASFTSLSGPCLDHAAWWFRRRMSRPTPRHVRQLAAQWAKSWYIAAFHLPLAGPAWRHIVAPAWPMILTRSEGITRRPGFPEGTLADDAVNALNLYRANIRPSMRRPGHRRASVPVQVIVLTRDHYLSGSLVAEDLGQWVPCLIRRTLDATHWSALTEKGSDVARMIDDFAAGLR